MNKLFIFLFFISFSAIGQTQNQITLLPSKTEIKTPITVDLNNYTHIVSINSLGRNFNLLSPLKVITPKTYDPKTYKKLCDKRWRCKEGDDYLFKIKNPKWLYMIKSTETLENNRTVVLIVKDYQNKIIYHAIHRNTGILERLKYFVQIMMLK